MIPINWAVVGILLTFALFLAGVIYKLGHMAARVEELERWRGRMLATMHEVSESINSMTLELKKLSTLIEERTDRRLEQRED